MRHLWIAAATLLAMLSWGASAPRSGYADARSVSIQDVAGRWDGRSFVLTINTDGTATAAWPPSTGPCTRLEQELSTLCGITVAEGANRAQLAVAFGSPSFPLGEPYLIGTVMSSDDANILAPGDQIGVVFFSYPLNSYAHVYFPDGGRMLLCGPWTVRSAPPPGQEYPARLPCDPG
jgi:hypothetical protein